MKTLQLARQGLVGAALIAIVSACGGTGAQSGAVLPGDRPVIRPQFKSANLLWVADAEANKIDVLTYPQGDYVGSFTSGVSSPEGECVNAAGDVYVANAYDSNILIYPRNSLNQPYTAQDPGYYPADCSVDAITGDLAVANSSTTGSKAGSVAIYTNPSGSPAIYTAPNFYWYHYCGYDGDGNLFVDGTDNGSTFEFAELPKGGNKFSSVTVNVSVQSPGPVRWDGKYLTLGDAAAGLVYRLQISGSQATVIGSTKFKGSKPLRTFWIVAGKKKGARSSPAVPGAEVIYR